MVINWQKTNFLRSCHWWTKTRKRNSSKHFTDHLPARNFANLFSQHPTGRRKCILCFLVNNKSLMWTTNSWLVIQNFIKMAETIVWYGLTLIKVVSSKQSGRFSLYQKEKVKGEQACLFFAAFDKDTRTVKKHVFCIRVSFSLVPSLSKAENFLFACSRHPSTQFVHLPTVTSQTS